MAFFSKIKTSLTVLRLRLEHTKLHYYPETDSLYIDLNARPSVDSRKISDGLVIDFDDQGSVVGIDIQEASSRIELSAVELETYPSQDSC